MKVAIMYGEPPEDAPPDEKEMYTYVEHEKRGLLALGYEVCEIPISLNMEATKKRVLEEKPDVVLNVTDAIDGKSYFGYLAPLLLEDMKIPFTGGSSQAIYLTTDKILSKRMLRNAGIPTPDWIEPDQLLSPPLFKGKRYIVKSLTEDGSVGMTAQNVVDTPEAMAQITSECRKEFAGEWFAEEYIDGREFNIALMAREDGAEIFPLAEIVFTNFPAHQPKILDYTAKWVDESPEAQGTVRVFPNSPKDQKLYARLREISWECWQLFRLTGYARVDFRIDAQGEPFVLEVNVNPYLAEDGGFMAAARQKGLDYPSVMKSIVASALRRSNNS